MLWSWPLAWLLGADATLTDFKSFVATLLFKSSPCVCSWIWLSVPAACCAISFLHLSGLGIICRMSRPGLKKEKPSECLSLSSSSSARFLLTRLSLPPPFKLLRTSASGTLSPPGALALLLLDAFFGLGMRGRNLLLSRPEMISSCRLFVTVGDRLPDPSTPLSFDETHPMSTHQEISPAKEIQNHINVATGLVRNGL
uniref:Secreted protein n=1 Tax=Kalanchoe fedtschenkoi TaxID=63787 RepID=A0A7N0UCS5_KALFE